MFDGSPGSLGSAEVFRFVDPSILTHLIPSIRTTGLAPGEVLLTRGDDDQYLYIVTSGSLRVLGLNRRGEECTLFDTVPGESVNEMAVLTGERASFTVLATLQSTVAVVPRNAFEVWAAQWPAAGLTVVRNMGSRLRRFRLAASIHMSEVFRDLDPASAADLEQDLELFTLYGGEVLFRQGDVGDFLCFVICGRIRVRVRNSAGEEITIAEFGPGEIAGEMAVVTGEPRTATVEAIRDTQLAKMTRAGFDRFMAKHPRSALLSVTRKLALRLSQSNPERPRRFDAISTIALVPSHDGAPVSGFAESLKAALEKFGSVAHLTSAAVNTQLNRDGIAQTWEREGGNIRLIEWLAGLEMSNAFVLYEADPVLSPWTERCIRQADQILVVGHAEAPPEQGEIETQLLNCDDAPSGGRNQWLILVHGGEEPSGTIRWLESRPVQRHFHVRLREQPTVDRVARFLTGRAVGLTLGGGFARGLAHAGVFGAFRDLGLPVDAVGGASMGALVGGLYALGWNEEKIVRETCAGCSQAFNDLTFPFIAFKTGSKFSALVRRFFGDVRIEDLWMPYFCISANLNRSELHIHTRGSMAKAVLAATRAPGVFPPIVYDGELHVDGGVINNVPVDIMKRFCREGVTVGVDVSPPHELNPVDDYGDDVSGWRAFRKRLFSKNPVYTPSILLVMIRTLEFSGISYKSARLASADVYMYPEMLRFKRTDFHLADGIVQAGYDCATKNMKEWLERSSHAGKSRSEVAEAVADAFTAGVAGAGVL